jgi:hypothetical protein
MRGRRIGILIKIHFSAVNRFTAALKGRQKRRGRPRQKAQRHRRQGMIQKEQATFSHAD